MASRVLEVTSRPDPVVEPAEAAPLPKGPYGLRTRELRAAYRTGDDPGEAAGRRGEALAFPDVEIAAGERLLVTGPSGSGKTTYAILLVRFLDPSSGAIELVATGRTIDLRALSSIDVRRVICLCEQEPHIFDTSVLENVRLARPDASESEIALALARAQLSPWIESLPKGLSTLVGEHGARLSGGQQQRLALARALLADAPVIVFDEPTEHLDEETAVALTADLLAATEGRTVVMITHRPELIASAGWDARMEIGSGVTEAPEPSLVY
jgi:ABC-type bacteriocin/lantibiotic exporter with double-glycine peptidase domain